jgi:opacity protein-like surface antigen
MKKVALLCVVAIELYAGGVMEPDYITRTQEMEIKQDKMFYAYIMAGNSVHSIQNKIGNSLLTNGALDDQGKMIDIGLGYKIYSNLFLELSYQQQVFEQNQIDNFYASINYMYLDNGYKPYVGVLAGYSQLTWDKNPITVFQSFETTSTSYLFGIQAGIEIPLTESLSFSSKYQFMLHDHILDVRNISSAITNKNAHNLLVGLKYEF